MKTETDFTCNGLRIIEKGFTDGAPEYFNLMYAVVTKKENHECADVLIENKYALR